MSSASTGRALALVRRVVPGVIRQPLSSIRLLTTIRYLLFDFGLFRSMRTGTAVDAEGRPVPWYTFPAIAWLGQLDFSEADVFEYGAGQSTLWWQARARHVTSVEHDAGWHANVAARVDERTTLRLETDVDRYVDAAVGGTYEVVVIDGLDRDRCADVAVSVLRPGGVLILDNADRHPALCERLRARGLIEVDFTGFGPVNFYTWTTSAFLDPAFSMRPTTVQPQVGIGGVAEDVCG